MQVKLLRAIQEGKITRVGGDKDIPLDVRIIAATNRDLKREVDEGRFRMDLFYRLSVIPITIPSLKERKEDIPMLIKYFMIKENQTISAHHLARKVVLRANANDVYKAKDDISCAVVYFREPRRLLICSGPPYNNDKDSYLAQLVENYSGKKIVCGGTTAQIVSRELHRDIEVGMLSDKSGLPPASKMEGVELVTEGILTIGKVAEMLEGLSTSEVEGVGPAFEIVKLLLKSDVIDFVIGTKINVAHQDPSLPVELEIRRNVVKRIVRVLEEKFLKEVNLQFI